ncbi:Single-stranded-DNA-specific exonuclease RecJ, partial [hydrothermal vent metagenome]
FSIVQIFPIGLSVASAQLIPSGMVGGVLNLPVPGTMVSVSPHFAPPIIRGLTVYPENPLRFGFIIDSGDDNLQGDLFEVESEKLIKYFLAALTTPEDEFWVNLSPYEKDRIIPDGLGVTELGRDMLAQDYLLKQLTASLMYPEDELGEEFWNRIYAKAQKIYGTTEIPVNTFNKVWIVPDKAVVYEHEGKVFVGERHLKVMLEEDYLAMENNQRMDRRGLIHQTQDKNTPNNFQSEIIREVLIPEIEKEVNEGELFANLRQIYNSMILATWYKQNLRESLLGQVYMDQNKVKGIDLEDKQIKQKIYDQYLEAFKIGVYDYIKEDYDSATKEIIPRKYFSGG